MKLLDKLKDILFDEEEEVEIPVAPKKPVVAEEPVAKQIVIEEQPKKVEVDNSNSERDLYHADNTFKFPIFDEQEFESTKKTVEKPSYEMHRSVEPRRETTSYQPRRDYEAIAKEKPEERKIFKPSPIISPVYGILDKNYKPEDQIIVSHVPAREIPSKLDVDSVRKKAFGQLDEELERTLNKSYEEFYKEEPKTVVEIMKSVEIPEVEDDEDFKTEDLKETLSDIRDNLEDIHESISSLETKVENKAVMSDEDLDKPRRAMDLLNEIEEELDEITSKKDISEEKEEDVKVVNEDKIDYSDDLEDEINIDVSDFNDEITDSDDSSNEELFNLIDAMYDTDKESE